MQNLPYSEQTQLEELRVIPLQCSMMVNSMNLGRRRRKLEMTVSKTWMVV